MLLWYDDGYSAKMASFGGVDLRDIRAGWRILIDGRTPQNQPLGLSNLLSAKRS